MGNLSCTTSNSINRDYSTNPRRDSEPYGQSDALPAGNSPPAQHRPSGVPPAMAMQSPLTTDPRPEAAETAETIDLLESVAITDVDLEVDLPPKEICRLDICFVCDTTGSMGTSVQALALTIKQFFSIIKLLFPDKRARVAVVAYKDHCYGPGFISSVDFDSTENQLLRFVDNLRPTGNLDTPEAAKSGLHEALRLVEESIKKNGDTSQTIVIHYTDTCPHHEQSQSHQRNRASAVEYLKNRTPGYDMIAIANHFKRINVPVFTFLTVKGDSLAQGCYSYLGELTILTSSQTYNITKATVGLLIHLLGETFEFNQDYQKLEIQGKEEMHTIRDETLVGGFPRASNMTFKAIPFRFDRLDTVWGLFSVRDLLLRLKEDEEYVSVVFAVLNDMMTRDNVMALTYNPIIGKIWRQICKRRTDPRLDQLRGKLSLAQNQLDAQKQLLLKTWLEESYNEADEITNLITDVPRQVPCLYIDAAALAADPVSKDELRSLARAPSPKGLAIVQKLLTQMHIAHGQPEKLPRNDMVPMYLPLGMSDGDLFGYLPHLMSQGMKFSLRPALIMAILCHISDNKHLAERARSFLKSQKGKWLNLNDVVNFPEVISEEMVKLVLQAKEYLVDGEIEVYELLHKISRIRRATRKEYKVTVATHPTVLNVWPDYKIECVACKFWRSFTITVPGAGAGVEGDYCGTCFMRVKQPKMYESYKVTATSAPDDMSHFATCKNCFAIYEIIKVRDLKVNPKCHDCRTYGKPGKQIQCCKCLNRFCDPIDLKKRLGMKAKDEWTCYICEKTPNRSFQQIDVGLKELLEENTPLMTTFGFTTDCQPIILGNAFLKNYRLYTDSSLWKKIKAAPTDKTIKSICVDKRECRDKEELVDTLVKDVMSGDLKGTCLLCFEDYELRSLQSACGKCKNRVCGECLRSWFGNLQPGKLVLTTHLMCAFCKKTPATSTIERYNKAAKALVRGEHLAKLIQRLLPNMYYGWCKGCSRIKEIGEMACGDASVMPFTKNDNFICESCKDDMQKAPNVPKCPGCNAPTVKSYGCNHIECPMCHTHWCYVCRKQFEKENIYDHLVEEHGSIGLEDPVDDEGAGVMHIDQALVDEDARARNALQNGD